MSKDIKHYSVFEDYQSGLHLFIFDDNRNVLYTTKENDNIFVLYDQLKRNMLTIEQIKEWKSDVDDLMLEYMNCMYLPCIADEIGSHVEKMSFNAFILWFKQVGKNAPIRKEVL